MTPKKCSIEQHLVPAGGPNQEIGDSVAARGKNGETDSYNPSFGGPRAWSASYSRGEILLDSPQAVL